MPHRFAALVALLGCSLAAHAQKTFVDWYAGTQDNNIGLYAATVNDSRGVLGLYCMFEDNMCYWLLKTDINCREGNSYPILVNSDSGSSHHEIYCIKLGDAGRFAFKNFDAIDSVVRSNKTLGIAFPMQSGRFQVSRFSLAGAAQALDYMQSAMSKAPTRSRGTRDQTL
jgi:hypothetical protein